MGRLEQLGVEVLTEGPAVTDSRVHALGIETMSAQPGPGRLHALGIEVMSSEPVTSGSSQIVVTGGRRRRRVVI